MCHWRFLLLRPSIDYKNFDLLLTCWKDKKKRRTEKKIWAPEKEKMLSSLFVAVGLFYSFIVKRQQRIPKTYNLSWRSPGNFIISPTLVQVTIITKRGRRRQSFRFAFTKSGLNGCGCRARRSYEKSAAIDLYKILGDYRRLCALLAGAKIPAVKKIRIRTGNYSLVRPSANYYRPDLLQDGISGHQEPTGGRTNQYQVFPFPWIRVRRAITKRSAQQFELELFCKFDIIPEQMLANFTGKEKLNPVIIRFQFDSFLISLVSAFSATVLWARSTN